MITSKLKKNNSNVVPNTTCFKEHEKFRVNCLKSQCSYWHADENFHNCILIAAKHGPMTLHQIGEMFGVTRMRICQVEKLIFNKLHSKIQNIET